jgi:hypothetical protein
MTPLKFTSSHLKFKSSPEHRESQPLRMLLCGSPFWSFSAVDIFILFCVKPLFMHRLTDRNATFSLLPILFFLLHNSLDVNFFGLKTLSSSKLCSWCIDSGVVCAYSPFLVLYTIRPYPVSLLRHWCLIREQVLGWGCPLLF